MQAFLPLLLFLLAFGLVLFGYPVAFTLGGVSILLGLCVFEHEFFYLLCLRIFGIMNNYVLISVPLFVYMGLMLEKSGIAERLLETMALFFGRVRGGLAIAVVIVGGLLAASTGVVGATVITMGLISLPTMLKRGYSPTLAVGTICASGTLGQIIPPSVVLVLLGSVLSVSVGDLFAGAFIPGVGLVGLYIVYIVVFSLFYPKYAPAMPAEEVKAFMDKGFYGRVFKAFFLPLLLILAVLGSISLGIASPTESAAVGAFGATLLTLFERKLSFSAFQQVMRQTTHITTMVFTILVGATAFSLVFRGLGGDDYMVKMIEGANLSPNMFIFLVMLIMFFAGFFIDFIEIIFIIVPVVLPTFVAMKIDLLWLGVVMAVNLQTSFLTPPFGFALFYLKGVAPPEITTKHLYRGAIPFIIVQLIWLTLMIFFPEVITWLPKYLKN